MKDWILIVQAGVQYWEDATVNGVEDVKGDLIPCRVRDSWSPKIHLEKGRILDWPQGTTAIIHYKVCDAGEYWIADESGKVIYKYDDPYVPDLLSVDDEGYGDYIIMEVGADGFIKRWKFNGLDQTEWEVAEGDE